jgi:ABC-type branched-subunit amino acid transport system substrate-binding protein
MVVIDTRGEGGGAAEGYRRLVGDPGIVAVLGPMLSWEVAAVRDEAALAGLSVIAFSQKEFPPGAPVFRFSMSKEDQAGTLAAYAVTELGLRRWAILHPEDNYGQDLAILFRDRVESLGGEVRAVVGYDPEKTDFQENVQRLQSRIGVWHSTGRKTPKGEEEKELEVLVDGVFLPDSAKRIALLAPHLAFFDIRNVQLLGASAWNDGEVLLEALPYVNGSVFVDGFFLYSFRPEVRGFVNAYRDAYGSNPGILEAYGYDAARLLLTEIRSGAGDRQRMAAHLRFPRLVTGATGWALRRADVSVEKSLFLLRVTDGTIREIERAAPEAPAFRIPEEEAAPQGQGEPWRRPEFDSRSESGLAPGTLGVPILRPEDSP